jgi:hypothetical protein
MGAFLVREGLFDERVCEAKQVEGKAAQEVLRRFFILSDLASR